MKGLSMLNKVDCLLVTLFLLWQFGQFHCVQTFEFNCNDTFTSGNWSCDEFTRILEYQGHQLSYGLNCMGYDKLKSPDEVAHDEGVTDHIIVGLKFTHINSLNDFTQVFEPEFWILEMWHDPRLKFPSSCPVKQHTNKTEGPTELEEYPIQSHLIEQLLWHPTLDLEKVIQMQTRHTFSADEGGFINSDGTVGRYKRYIAQLSCPMDFTLFPFDQQECHFNLNLRSLDKDMPKLVFDHMLKTNMEDIELPNWDVELTEVDNLSTVNIMGVRSPGIGMIFTFSRYWTYELMQTFLPSLMITITSVISVFIPAQHVPGRMGLCITAFLSLISLLNGSRTDWPPTTSLKAVDYWSGICYIIVFMALIEYSVVLYLSRFTYFQGLVVKNQMLNNKVQPCEESNRKAARLCEKIERNARFFMPAALIMCNAIFWSTTMLCD